ncbi:hypothetical protein [Methylocucumis oryzae]|uniref:Uncharacterized protein n=1 Tax=Methylocucumis oryzae TaxID=1632867 RepID=A0A0F3IJR3_9GAMM|nr:hypothetical protein [Methylocucumis oryzae]KJV05789.1 hypothetical protein VZ94_15610 [Methylocucumis oryzae]
MWNGSLAKNANLHPQFIHHIKSKIEKNPPNEPYLTFWRIIALKLNDCISTNIYHEFPNIKVSRDEFSLSALLKLLEPKIKFSKRPPWENNTDSPPYQAEVVIQIKTYQFKKLKTYYPEIVSLLLPITNFLNQAMNYWQLLGKADDKNDFSEWHLVSISPHDQNNQFHNWTLLIELCRDLWDITYKTNQSLALAVLEIWKTFQFPVFKRLIFDAFANSDCVSPSDKLDYLLTDNHWWFWSSATTREKFRLLASICPKLNRTALKILEQAILSGPPREMFRQEITDHEWQNINDRKVWLHLVKLESFNATLSKKLQAALNDLSTKYPRWKLEEGERSEFNIWFSTGRGNRCDITRDELITLPIQQRIEKLTESTDEFIQEERIDLFGYICRDKPDFALETLGYIAATSNWDNLIWHKSIMALSEANNPQYWLETAKLIVQLPDQFFCKRSLGGFMVDKANR